MRDNALYFPYISLPRTDWTIKALLYWDKLLSIVPMEFIDAPEQLSPFMRQLVQEGLVEQIFPAQYLYQLTEFERSFINLIESRGDAFLRSHSREFNSERIHMEKLGSITDYLIERGLANKIDWSWYDVDSRVAKLFMAYLASCLGAIPQVNAAPVTNQLGYASIFGNANRQSAKKVSTIHHEKARQVILRGLLPTPKEKVTLDQLVRFKEQHGHLLPALRQKIEAHCAQVAALPNPDDRILLTESFVAQSKIEIEEIIEAMKPIWSRLVFGSIAPLFGAGLALKTTGMDNQLAYAGSALSLVGAVYQVIATVRDNRNELLQRPLAYIAHARAGIYA